MATSWAILTGEHPPQPGGVSDYTCLVAQELARKGDVVHVFAPPLEASPQVSLGNVQVHRLSDHFGRRGLSELEASLAQLPRPRRVLVQYVPHAYGHRAMNVRFCRRLRKLARGGERVDVMFHEVAYPLEKHQRLRHRLLAYVTRWMARQLATSADRIFVSIPAWETTLNQLGIRRPMHWSPIPSTVSQLPNPAAVATVRQRFGDTTLIAHFGTYGQLVTPGLRNLMTLLSQCASSRTFMLLGRGGEEFIKQLAIDVPALAGRMYAPGVLDAAALSEHLAACDVMIQPYPDGVSSRRTSVMAGLALGVPIVTSIGPLTEPLWAQSRAVALAPTPDPKQLAATAEMILADPEKRAALGERARSLYRQKFDLEHVIETLRS